MSLIIGIDDRTIKNQYKGRGIGNYTEHIVEWLPKVDSSVGIETRDFSRTDVFLQPNFWDGFPEIKAPKVLMMHDLTPLMTNHFTERGPLINFAKSILYRLKMQNIKKADAVLTNSEHTKKDVVRHTKVSPDIVHAVHLGVDEEFKTRKPVPREERGNYVLFVGGVEANKNVLRLLEAFKNVKVQIIPNYSKSMTNDKYQISNLRLVIPGGQFVNREKIETKMIRARVKELGLENAIEFPGFVEQKELVELYRKALVFVYPSYYEGFGFPVLEAMASGTPVVSSNASSLPEVGGNAVIYVDPFDVESIAEGIEKILGFDNSDYLRMVQAGLEQSQKFSWQKCARETLQVLQSVLPSHKQTH